MAFEDDVLRSIQTNRTDFFRFYVDTYRSPALTEQDRAEYRSKAIEHEGSLLYSNTYESARLRTVEVLDSHPGLRGQVEQYVHELHRLEQTPQWRADDKPHGYDTTQVMREQLERLEGGFLGAVVQGVANIIWDDPAEALHKAAPFVAAAELLSAHGEAMYAGYESANRAGERFGGENREELVKHEGVHEVADALRNIGSDTPADQFPHAAETLGEGAVGRLDQRLGYAGTDQVVAALHPGETAGLGGYAAGEIRHSEAAEKESKHAEVAPEGAKAAETKSSGPEHHQGTTVPFEPSHAAANDAASVAHGHGDAAGHQHTQHADTGRSQPDIAPTAQHFLLPVGENTHLATHAPIQLPFDPAHLSTDVQHFVLPVSDPHGAGAPGHDHSTQAIPFEAAHLTPDAQHFVLPPSDTQGTGALGQHSSTQAIPFEGSHSAHHGGSTGQPPGHDSGVPGPEHRAPGDGSIHQSPGLHDPTHSTVLDHTGTHSGDGSGVPDQHTTHLG